MLYANTPFIATLARSCGTRFPSMVQRVFLKSLKSLLMLMTTSVMMMIWRFCFQISVACLVFQH